ncbi:MAG TPA: hypothetical protein VEI47_06505 [Gemmatimonadales bacterium]|nr:hypothetical protein [Gemmatimonadales bacterium]
MRQRFPALLSLLAAACIAPPPATPSPHPPGAYVVRVTSGNRKGVQVDWAMVPDASWPIEGQRDKTPFELTIPTGRVATVFRPTSPTNLLEVTLLERQRDGTLRSILTSASTPVAVVVLDPAVGDPLVLAPEAGRRLSLTGFPSAADAP